MAKGVSIEGLDDCLKWIENCPENCMKATRNAMREASKATTKQIRARIPKRWRKMLKYKVSKTSEGKLNAGIGLFNGHQRQGHQTSAGVDDWFKAYWSNYGTLSHRDPRHRFQNPIKRGSTSAAHRRRNNEGQPAQNFFEGATERSTDTFVKAFAESLKKQEKTFYER